MKRALSLWLLCLLVISCDRGREREQDTAVELTLGAYTTPREVFRELIPVFSERWKREHSLEVRFQESYLGSGAQSRAILEGFEADVAALSLEPDLKRLHKGGLIRHDWKSGENRGMVSRSVVVLGVRAGNPKKINDWHDLTRTGVGIVMPNPRTSGGAMWNILAIYGASSRGKVEGVKPAPEEVESFLGRVVSNIVVMDKGARESMTSFEKGVGDVVVTYENELLLGRKSGRDYEIVYPSSTILIENPIALVDEYVDEHNTREVSSAFLEFLLSPEAQEKFAEFGYRRVSGQNEDFPKIEDQFTIEDLGGWESMVEKVFSDEGVFPRVQAGAR